MSTLLVKPLYFLKNVMTNKVLTTNVSLCLSNVQSLNSEKMEHITIELSPCNDIICVNETNLNEHRNINFSLTLDGFQPIFRKDISHGQWGGVAVYISNSIFARRII